jgi:putative chitinase
MGIMSILEFIILGIILGMAGQGARSIVGMKKQYDKKSNDWFDGRLLVTSLMIGGTAGAFGAVGLLDNREIVDKQTLLTLITIGYAGTDFIEGFMKKS